MSDDLTQRLRDLYWETDMSKRAIGADICSEAADEIESLRKQLAAFQRIATQSVSSEIDRGLNPAQSAGEG